MKRVLCGLGLGLTAIVVLRASAREANQPTQPITCSVNNEPPRPLDAERDDAPNGWELDPAPDLSAAFADVPAAPTLPDPGTAQQDAAARERLRGMSEAVKDIEKGVLKFKRFPLQSGL